MPGTRAAGSRPPPAQSRALQRAAIGEITYPAELPISQRRDEIAAAIAGYQVVIVAGETGSGKTTQLPKICLDLGRGSAGQIGHTQPRRLAARTVAERIAEELGTEPGTAVGYQVRFTDTSSERTLVKLMTDGILLTELHRDRRLLRYDTLIIDEAHERSLNVDFILGYLRQLLPSRPDLKVVITSATIDPERFAAHFGGAPVIEVSGRAYPVQVRYRPLDEPAAGTADGEPRDQLQAICDAVDELSAEPSGDILIFLSGEREIRDTAEALAGRPFTDVLPLYSRLSAAEQHRVFQPHASRRIVLATNVAETSLTVPGIKYVIDPGTARISRYSQRTKVQRLPIEPISRASADQRKGRCGRTSDGVCVRLYSEEDFNSRPEFTDPEILRTHLAAVLLRMADLELGAVTQFPFLEPPDTRNVTDGIRLLTELGAVSDSTRGSRGAAGGGGRAGDADPEGGTAGRDRQDGAGGGIRLTPVGRSLARLPVDPRLGRMILEAGRNGCAREVLIIAAALSIQDPRERPADAREAADASHARFAVPGSDFLAYLRLWDYLRAEQLELSGSAFRRMCRREYLHYLRVREWQDLVSQLRQAARQIGVTVEPGDREPGPAPGDGRPDAARSLAGGAGAAGTQSGSSRTTADGADAGEEFPAGLADRVHQSLLAGLLSQIGMRDDTRQARAKRPGPAVFAGARGAIFSIFPDSSLARKPPRWVVAAELVETSRLWARTVARIEPEWAEHLAPHLVRRSYSEPRWDAGRGAAIATEKVTLYGLPIVAARRIQLGRVDPELARELFIRHALVEGDWQAPHRFRARNQKIIKEIEELEKMARRRAMAIDDAALFGFYDRRVPAEVISARHFDSWWKRARSATPDLLDLSPGDLTGPDGSPVAAEDYPVSWGGLPVTYEFAPGEPGDGVTVGIPLAALNQVRAEEFSWQVPGLRLELVTELIRGLPKQLRTSLVPAPDVARAVLERLGRTGPGGAARPRGAGGGQVGGDLLGALGDALAELRGVRVPREAWNESRLPAHLRITFRVTDGDTVLAAGPDLAGLRRELEPELRATLADAARDLTRTGLRTWDFDTLPPVFERGEVRGYPALADAGDCAEIRLFATAAQARAAMRAGVVRLLLLEVGAGARSVASRLPSSAKLALSRGPYPNAGALLDDCAAAAAGEIVDAAGDPPRDAAGYAALLEAARAGLRASTAEVISAVVRVMTHAHQVEAELDAMRSPVFAAAVADMREQLAGLIGSGFISRSGARRLADLARYLRGISYRLDRGPQDVRRDLDRMAVVHRVRAEYERALAALGPERRPAAAAPAEAIRWQIEELRISLFAVSLGTAGPVSEQRIMAALDAIRN